LKQAGISGFDGLDLFDESNLEGYEEFLITDEQNPQGEKKKVKIPIDKNTIALKMIAKLQENGQEVDVNLLKALLNLNDDGSNLNRVN